MPIYTAHLTRSQRASAHDSNYTFIKRTSGLLVPGPLELHYEIEHEAVCREFCPDESSLAEVWEHWRARCVAAARPGTEIWLRIDWRALTHTCPEPFWCFCDDPTSGVPYTHPVHAITGQPVVWGVLPVTRTCWPRRPGMPIGLIEAATGWRPAALQRWVALAALDAHRAALLGLAPRARRRGAWWVPAYRAEHRRLGPGWDLT
jgi:hypothetical protein